MAVQKVITFVPFIKMLVPIVRVKYYKMCPWDVNMDVTEEANLVIA